MTQEIYEAFCEFEDLGLEDYIMDIDLNLRTRVMPADRFTFGDVLNAPIKFYATKPNVKVFKNIFDVNGNLNKVYENLINQQTNSITNISQNNIVESSQSLFSKNIFSFAENIVLKKSESTVSLDKLSEDLEETKKVLKDLVSLNSKAVGTEDTGQKNQDDTQTLVEDADGSMSVPEAFTKTEINQYTQTSETNMSIQNILNTKLEESNVIQSEYITQIENNLKTLTENHVNVKIDSLEKIVKEIVVKEEASKEFKQEIQQKTDEIVKFLRS